jgi:hypothetical protein
LSAFFLFLTKQIDTADFDLQRRIYCKKSVSIKTRAKLPTREEEEVCIRRGGIKIFKALARLASNSKFLLAKS